VQAQPAAIRVTVEDVQGNPGQNNVSISVFLTNVFDTVAAFELWLQLSRPDILFFQTNYDTIVDTTFWECIQWSGPNCVDSVSCDPDTAGGSCPIRHIDTTNVFVGNIDTVGTLIGGWDVVTTRSIAGQGLDIKITALANDIGIPGSGRLIAPQGGGVLFRLLGDFKPVSDTLTDRSADLMISSFLNHFNFSRPNGTSIGIISQQVPDSNFWRCESWVPPDSVVCLSWQRVYGPPWDSVSVDTVTVASLDTVNVKLNHGSATVFVTEPGACCLEDSCFIATGYDGCVYLAGGAYKGNGSDCDPNPCLTCCTGPSRGNYDGSADNLVTMGDLTVLIDHLFISFNPLDCLDEGNVDLSPDGLVTMGDLTVLIDHLFISFNPRRRAPRPSELN
jgi:hypothetical protein